MKDEHSSLDDPVDVGKSAEVPPRRPLQFGIRGLLLLTFAVAMLFGVLRWLDVSSAASTLVLLILIISGIAAVGLLAAIMRE